MLKRFLMVAGLGVLLSLGLSVASASAQSHDHPIYFDGPSQIVAGQTLMQVRAYRPTLVGEFKSQAGFSGSLDVVSRSGPDTAGVYHFAVRIWAAPLGPATLSFFAETPTEYDQLDNVPVNIVGNTGPYYGPFRSAVFSGALWGGAYVSANVRFRAARAFHCTSSLQVQRRVRTRKKVHGHWRTVSVWRALRNRATASSGCRSRTGKYLTLIYQRTITLSKRTARSLGHTPLRTVFSVQYRTGFTGGHLLYSSKSIRRLSLTTPYPDCVAHAFFYPNDLCGS